MKTKRYKVSLDSAVYGHETTKWDTRAEADSAVESIIAETRRLQDSVTRTVRIVYGGRVERRIQIMNGEVR